MPRACREAGRYAYSRKYQIEIKIEYIYWAQGGIAQAENQQIVKFKKKLKEGSSQREGVVKVPSKR